MLKFFLPWYLRWLFLLPWIFYLAGGAAVGYFAYVEYENYRFEALEAQIQVSEGAPDPVPLSRWSATNDVTGYNEVNVEGLYFPALPHGQFGPTGGDQEFIVLADDLGQEIKAVLVVQPNAMRRLTRYLTAQSTGDAAQGTKDGIRVTVNGTRNGNVDWAQNIDRALAQMGVPQSGELVVIEPFVGNRTGTLFAQAQKTYDSAVLLGVIAGFLAVYGVLRLLFKRGGTNKSRKTKPKDQVRAAQKAKQPTQKALPTGATPEASPWGTFQPLQDTSKPTQKPDAPTRDGPPQKQKNRKGPSAKAKGSADISGAVHFESVFPGGGSGFRFKSADEIILQTFGTVSTLIPAKRDD